MWETSVVPVESVYIHVPFCAHKCEYCAFYSEYAGGDLIQRYVAALTREMESVADRLRPRTAYFGGGTPSLLNLGQWRQVFQTMSRLNWLGADEWTVECNPATVSLDKARLWRDHGVNRISLGVQSLDEALLDRLGRVHSRAMVFKTFAILRTAGFDNIGLDLMFAIPGQSLDIWRATLDEALALEPEHLSCYEVIYEEDTPLYAQLQASQFSVDEDLACAMYDELIECAASHGFSQYEIANFARHQRSARTAIPRTDRFAGVRLSPGAAAQDTAAAFEVPSALEHSKAALAEDGRTPTGASPSAAAADPDAIPAFACRHNINYWRGGSFFGLGPSAASFLSGVRTKNWPNTLLYCEQIERGEHPIETRDELSALQRAGEIAAFGLRMVAGWRFDQFQAVTGFDLRQEWQSEIQQLADQEWGVLDPERFRLTRLGLRFADAAAELFLRLPEPS